jgi:CheY-like chemotaxis protein|tara:strand:+ start:5840 stop:6289 length:450 start_codon:yes stop_codon:yes gene_type:complete
MKEDAIAPPSTGKLDFTLEGPMPKIICAEDNAANRAILRVLLEKLNQNCTFVENGAELIAHLNEDSYDLILLDINMPVMNGIEACQMIRNGGGGELHRAVFISALTAAASDESKQAAIDAGMDCFMTKPFTTEILKNIIKQYQEYSSPS